MSITNTTTLDVTEQLVRQLTISGPAVEAPIRVIFESLRSDHGRMTIAVHGRAWTGNWTRLTVPIEQMVADASTEYVCGGLTSMLYMPGRYEPGVPYQGTPDYLKAVIGLVQSALRQQFLQQRIPDSSHRRREDRTAHAAKTAST